MLAAAIFAYSATLSADEGCPVSGLCGLGGDRIGDLQEHHSQVEERGLQQLLLAIGEVPLVFSTRTASRSIDWRAPMMSTRGFWPGSVAAPIAITAER